LWAVVPITVIWANLHASVLLSPVICAMYAIGALIEERVFSANVRRMSFLGAACAAAVCATPLGIELPRYTIALMGSPVRQWIAEWSHTQIGNVAFAVGALPLLLILAVRSGRKTETDRIVIVMFTILLFSAVRNVPVFAIVVAPIAASVLGLSVPPLQKNAQQQVASMMTLAAAILATVSLPLVTLSSTPPPDPVPLGAAKMLKGVPNRSSRVFCEDFAWCSVFLGDRTMQVFMDGRCDPYPLPVWSDYIAVIDGKPVWSNVLDRWHVDAILARPGGPLDALLIAKQREWSYLGSSGRARVYLRRASPPGPVFRRD
jgi:hypothetical protein